MDNASGEGAQGLAWYAYNSCQFQVAHEWFERATAWLPKEATVYGYALTLQKHKKTKEFWDVMNRYDGLFPKVIDIIYPDDQYHPPTPCDLVEGRGQQRVRPQGQAAYTVPAPYVAGQPYAASPYGAAPYATAPGAATYGGAPAVAYSAPPPAAPMQGAQPAQPGQPYNPFALPPGAPGPMMPHGHAGSYPHTA